MTEKKLQILWDDEFASLLNRMYQIGGRRRKAAMQVRNAMAAANRTSRDHDGRLRRFSGFRRPLDQAQPTEVGRQ